MSCSVEALKIFLLSIFYLLDILLLLIHLTLSLLIYAPYAWISATYLPKSRTNKAQKRIVIIGYSFAGFEVHKYLQKNAKLKHYQFSIIEAKTYFEFTPSVLSTIVNPSKYPSIVFPLTQCFDNTRSELIHGKAMSIDTVRNCVRVQKLANEQIVEAEEKTDSNLDEIFFDYLFICTGSGYAQPIKTSVYPKVAENIHYKARAAMFERMYSKFNDDSQKSVAIIGAGAVGVELMAEIIETFPDKKVTIIDLLPVACRFFPKSTQKYICDWIEKRENIELRLNTRIRGIITPYNSGGDGDFFSGNEMRLFGIEQYKSSDRSMCRYQLKLENAERKQEILAYDMIFRCAGFEPNSHLFREEKQFQGCLTKKWKFLRVDGWMRVNKEKDAFENIFALGDVLEQPRINEVKLAHTAEIHAQYIRDLMVYLGGDGDISLFVPYHEWLLGRSVTSRAKNEDGDGEKKWKMPLIFTLSLGERDGSMGFGGLELYGFISQIFKWFIEVSLCKLYHRKGIFDITVCQQKIFTMYPIGYTIFSLIWKLNHIFTMWYIRHYNK